MFGMMMTDEERAKAFKSARDVYDVLNGMTEEQLKTVKFILEYINAFDPSNSASFYRATVKQILFLKHGLCPVCNEHHEETEPCVMAEVPATPMQTPPTPEVGAGTYL